MATKAIYAQELIGKNVEIIASRNPSLRGKRGKIVDETRNMLRIDDGQRVIAVLKRGVSIKLSSGEVIECAKLIHSLGERIKGIKSKE